MPVTRTTARVYFDDDTEIDVRFDQRDSAAWEATALAKLGPGITQIRWVVWNAAKRAGQTTLTWDRWQKDVVEVSDVPNAEGETANPGTATPSEDI